MCIGSIVLVKSGHDKGKICLVIGNKPEGYVYIANGKQRPVTKPKLKNIKHLEKIAQVDFDCVPTNRQIKQFIAAYTKTSMGGK